MKILSKLLNIQIDKGHLIWNINLVVFSLLVVTKAMRPK